MAHNDPVVRVYHTKQPTPGQLLGTEVPVWPDDYALAAILPPLDGAPEAILEQAFDYTQLCHPEASKIQWAGERRRSTSPGDVVVLGNGQAYRCAFSGWDPLTLPPPGFWTAQVARCRSALIRVLG
jgi:hypothetical protein